MCNDVNISYGQNLKGPLNDNCLLISTIRHTHNLQGYTCRTFARLQGFDNMANHVFLLKKYLNHTVPTGFGKLAGHFPGP